MPLGSLLRPRGLLTVYPGPVIVEPEAMTGPAERNTEIASKCHLLPPPTIPPHSGGAGSGRDGCQVRLATGGASGGGGRSSPFKVGHKRQTQLAQACKGSNPARTGGQSRSRGC